MTSEENLKKWLPNYKYHNLLDIFTDAVKKYKDNPLFGVKNNQGDYEWITYGEIGKRVDNFRSAIHQLGLKKGDVVGGIFNNRPEYAVVSFGTYGIGGRWIPMYLKERPQVWKYIINDADIKLLVVNDDETYDKIMEFKDELPNLKHIYIIETERDNSLANLEKMGEGKYVEPIKPEPNDIACLIYTSGTTGDPKGVLLSHFNLASNTQAGYEAFKGNLNENTVFFSILPWAHSYALTAEFHNCFQFGGRIGLMESVEKLTEDMPKVRPTHLIAVPRVFNMIYSGLYRKMEEEGGIKYKLFLKAIEVAKKKHETGKGGILYPILKALVINKIRAAFGGKLHTSLTASAVMNVEIAKFFIYLGINVYDAYGMTETSPAATLNTPDAWKIGSVGKPIKDVTIVIDKERVGEDSKDGEIIIYGPNVMQGYHNKPEKTKEVMTPDGGVRSGDRGWLDEDGFLYITGRFKEEYKLENGKYVHPASIEEDMKLLPYVQNAFVYGDNRPYNVALVVPNMEIIQEFLEKANIEILKDPAEIFKSREVREFLARDIQAHLAKKYGGYEIPKRFWYILEDFTVENNMLTQTLKLKRRNVLKKYKDIIEYLYTKDHV